MAHIPPHIVDDIMQTARIEEVIGEFVQLKRAGANLKGLSPFTDEKTASFVVSPAKQIFKCFSTGKGGNVASFLMEKEHYSYPEALKWLAEKYGIMIPEDRPATPEELAKITERESLHIINEFAANHFKDNLHNTDEGKRIALSYFIERGFRPDIIEKFQLGYSINKSDNFSSAALEKGYKLDYMSKVGLTKVKEDNNYFDFFRGRVMFPIHSVTGRVLGFGGRTLFTDKKIAKYYNSPESIIYNKSEILYGLHFSKGDIIKYDNCFLCEGYTDVISMYQAGVQNVVSSSGTSLTKEQIRLVKRYTKNITILYDGDNAGIKASFRGIDLILQEGMNVKVVLFPDGEDPDSYSKAVSTTELEDYIKEHTQDFISFKAGILLDEDDKDPIKRASLIKEIVQSVSLIPDQITRNVYMQSISERFNINENILSNELIHDRQDNLAKAHSTPEVRDYPVQKTETEPQTQTKNITIEVTEYDLARILVLYGPNAVSLDQIDEDGKKIIIETSVAELVCHELDVDELYFENPMYSKIYSIVKEKLDEKVFLKSSAFIRMNEQEIVQFVSELEMDHKEISHNWATIHNIFTKSEKDKIYQAVMGSIYAFKSAKIEQQIRKIQQDLKENEQELPTEVIIDMLSEQQILENIKMAFSEKLGRIII